MSVIGHWLHFGFSDMLEMTADELYGFFKAAKDIEAQYVPQQ